MDIPYGKTFLFVPNFDAVTLTSNIDLLLKKKTHNLGVKI